MFRKTAATILDEAGLSARQVADQLGHSRPSLTQDVYMGRKAVGKDAAQALEDAGDMQSVVFVHQECTYDLGVINEEGCTLR